MIYELWDTDTFNLVGSYESEADALGVVRSAVARHGTGYVEGLALVSEDDRGRSRTLAEGRHLLDRAEGTVSAALAVDR